MQKIDATEFLMTRPNLNAASRTALFLRVTDAFKTIIMGQNWTTLKTVTESYCDESMDFIGALVLMLQETGVLFDDDLLSAADWESADLPDDSKLWTGDLSKITLLSI